MKKILLVDDDDDDLLRVYGYLLSKDGFEVETCRCGKELLQRLEKGIHLDLIILDLELPDIDGLRLLEQLRAQIEFHAIPIIINSGYAHKQSDFISWLADAFIVKKSDINELKETIAEILK